MPINGPKLTELVSVCELLSHGLGKRPDDPAVLSLKSNMTWRQLSERCDMLAAQYAAMGLKPGDRIASLMPNRPLLVIHYLACLRAGFVATPLNYRYMPPEIDHALQVSKASLLVHHVERDEDVASTRHAKQLPKGMIRYKDRNESELLDGFCRVPRMNFPTPQPDQPAFIFFTSGSAGKPKGVAHTRQSIAQMLSSAIQSMEITESDAFLPGASLSHIGGTLFSLSTLAAGARLVVRRGNADEEMLGLLRRFRPTVLFMLPAALTALIRDRNVGSDDFSSVRLCVSGGDKVAAELEREFTELAGIPIDESYGMTEIGIATINPPSGENRIGSVGKLGPGYEARLCDNSGEEVPVGTRGRLWIRSHANALGYWDDPQATEIAFHNGWIDTGDVMRVDADGYLWFGGRKKQIIVHDGSNICPQDVEAVICEHPAIEAAGVVGVHDLIHGENVRAYVTFKTNAKQPAARELIQFCRERIGYKSPEEIIELGRMPLNATGKVDRAKLKQLSQSESLKLQ